MSFEVKTVKKGTVLASFIGHPIAGVAIGKYEIPLDHFCSMAAHFLGGGFFGWGKETPTPKCVNEALSYLFQLYKREGEKWIRKNEEDLRREEEQREKELKK